MSCSRHPFDEPVDHYSENVKESFLINGGLTFRPELLEGDDFRALYLGQARIRVWLQTLVLPANTSRWWPNKCTGEWTDKACERNRWWEEKMAPKLLRALKTERVDVLAHIKSVVRTLDDDAEGVCNHCRRGAAKELRAARRRLWDLLPTMFDLDAFQTTCETANPFFI